VSPERSLSMIEVAIGNGGIRRAVRGLSYLAMWGLTFESDPEREPNRLGWLVPPDAVAEHWSMNRKTAYRWLTEFRACFPGEENPQRLWLLLRDHVTERKSQQKAVGELAVMAWPG
jgi:hypothetical protein